METIIVKDYAEFIIKMSSCGNAVTQKFLDDNNLTLETLQLTGCIGCFNCYNCSNCDYCVDCSNCTYCFHCTNCNDCSWCYWKNLQTNKQNLCGIIF